MNARKSMAPWAVFLAISLGGAFMVAAQQHVPSTPTSPEDNLTPKPQGWCGTGTLQVLETDGPEVRTFPLKHTRVDAMVSGTVTRVQVTQIFTNPYTETIEAVYRFPLPHEAAVHDLHMKLGERIIRGTIDRREAARQIYEQARQSGHVATLLEQERPNIFTQSVANILPGSEIEITITYIERLESENGTWEFAFPMVVGPRYLPPGAAADLPQEFLPASQPGPSPRIVPAPKDDGVNPPFLPPSVRSGHDIELTLTLDAGVAIDNLRSPTHAFTRSAGQGGRVIVGLHPADTIPNKDFVLRWDIGGDEPETAVLTHHDGKQGYVSVIVHPKQSLSENEVTPKEMVFVLDCSGSMHGEPMAAAKALARRALLDMRPQDSFQIIRFSNRASGFSPMPVAATPENVRRGLAYLEKLSGGGGTQMIEGILASLAYPADPHRLRIVMFLTDGYIGNENDILAAVRDHVGSARLFAFGVGSSVNRFLLDEMAREGRGEVQYMLPGSNAQEEVEKFYARFRHPYLTDVELDWRGVDVVDVHPGRIPDLFEGRSLVVRGRYVRGGKAELRIRGRIAGQAWERRMQVDLPNDESGNPAIGSLWAQTRIADLERSMRHGENPVTIEAITDLGLQHRLVTRWTSFVAVEEQLVVSDGQPRVVAVPVDMPQGVGFEAVFGESEQAMSPCAKPAQPTGFLSRMNLLGGFLGAPPAQMEAIDEDSATRSDGRGGRIGRPLVEHEKKGEAMTAIGALAIRLSVASTSVTPQGTVVLRLQFRNQGSVSMQIPAVEASWRDYGLQVIDSRWNELQPQTLSGRIAARMAVLAPGEVVVRELTIPLAELGKPQLGSTLHFILDGRRWGAIDVQRVEVQVLAG